MKIEDTFQRTEKKYLLTEWQWQQLKKVLEPHMELDVYGLYTICNIYYDTNSYELIRNSLEKPVYKEKLRLRSYGIPSQDSKVFLEIKKKYQGIVYKRRIALLLNSALNYLKKGIVPKEEYNHQIFSEIDYFIHFYRPKPVLYLAYDRIAYAGKEDSHLRLTVDRNIRSREEELSLEAGDHGKLLLSPEERLVEIKTSKAFPIWLARSLNELKIYPTSFSKYGAVYRKKLEREKNNFFKIQDRLEDYELCHLKVF